MPSFLLSLCSWKGEKHPADFGNPKDIRNQQPIFLGTTCRRLRTPRKHLYFAQHHAWQRKMSGGP